MLAFLFLVVGCSEKSEPFQPVQGCDERCVAQVAEQVTQDIASKIYVRADSESGLIGTELFNTIDCDQGDIVLAGGCLMGGGATPRGITGSQPELDGWACRYERLATDIVENIEIVATAVCLDSSDL